MLIALYTAAILLAFGLVSYILKRLNTWFYIFAATTLALSIAVAFFAGDTIAAPLILAIISYYVWINIFTFFLYGWDKGAAMTNMWRVSERQLHMYMFFGGALGAILGQKIFRHKTQKLSFRIVFWSLLVIQLLIPVGLLIARF
ncbi:MAG: DUF1294 domain-containing protein [Methyloligellaceae bacterium]